MSSTVVLHVGLMKSGTTFLQQQIYAHRETLHAQGVFVPGEHWSEQALAVKDVLQQRTPDHWAPFAQSIRDHDGTSLVSMEFMGPARRGQQERIIESLRPAKVVVVISARDLNRGIVALWQETIQNGRTWTWPDYVEGVRVARPGQRVDPVPDTGRTFWRQQDLARIAEGWAETADEVVVLTVPPPGAPRTLLLDRFTDVLGIDRLPIAETRSNESLGLESVLVLRRMNELLNERGLTFPQGSHLRKRLLAKTLMAARKKEESALGLEVPDWLAEASEEQVRRSRSLPVRLVGDWDELTPVPVPGVGVGEIEERDVAEAAVAALAALVAHQLD